MFGGEIIKVSHLPEMVVVHVCARTFAGTCMIRLVPNKHNIQVGDTICWLGGFAYWSNSTNIDVPIPRLGFVKSVR